MVITRRLVLVLGVIGLVTTMADTIRLFLRAADHSVVAVSIWSLFALWLLVPLGSVLRQFRRIERLGAVASGEIRSELRAAAFSHVILGYGTAGFALRVAKLCLPH